MKLNIGSGKDYREGWVNLEVNPKFKADVYADIMEYQPTEKYDEIVAKDVLDHVTYADALKLLPRIYSWLNNNGLFTVHTPNFDYCAKHALDGDHEAMTWIYGSDGTKAHYSTNFIKWAYTIKSLKLILESIGFLILNEEITCGGYGFRMLATKRE